MAFAEQSKYFVNFTGGKNTEATPLNFPENSAQELDNFDLFVTGEIKRRLGLDFETSYTVRPETITAANIANYAVATHEWKAVNGKGDINFLVVQIGTTLYFHNLGDEPISGTLRGSLSLASFRTGAAPENKVMSSSYGEGVMALANSDMDPAILQYDEDTDTFTAIRQTLKIRDFDGVDEIGDPEDDFRPTSLTQQHRYNLRNQGWPNTTTVNNTPGGVRGVTRNIEPIGYTAQKLNKYPSNADIFHAAKATAAGDPEVIGTYSPWALEQIATGNTPAPKGHYVLDLFSKDRTTASGVPVGAPQTTDKRPAVVIFFAGRVWYLGVPDKEYTGDVYFSQQLTDIKNANKCYQEYDPTAEDLNALLATDGGVIHIADMGEVYNAVVIGQELVIVSSTGVFSVSGQDGANTFTAEAYSIRKISTDGTVGRDTVVVAEGSMFWWGRGGIWAMAPGQIKDDWAVERITKDTIQTDYDAISAASRAYARGYYDDFSKKLYWLYNDTDGYDAINFRFKYNRALVLDTTLGAFYTHTFSDLDANSPWISSILLKTPGSESIITYDIFQGLDDIVEGGDDIVQDVAFESFTASKIKFLTFVANEDGTYSYTFSEFVNRNFSDWETWDRFKNFVNNTGANYDSVIQTGWNTLGDLVRNKTITHLTTFFNRTEDGYIATEDPDVHEFSNPSGAYVQVRWEFDDIDVGRWTNEIQAYRLKRSYIPEDSLDTFDYGQSVVNSKIRMRGRGTAFSVRFLSEEGKDMQLLGFAVNVRAGAKP